MFWVVVGISGCQGLLDSAVFVPHAMVQKSCELFLQTHLHAAFGRKKSCSHVCGVLIQWFKATCWMFIGEDLFVSISVLLLKCDCLLASIGSEMLGSST